MLDKPFTGILKPLDPTTPGAARRMLWLAAILMLLMLLPLFLGCASKQDTTDWRGTSKLIQR